MEERVENAWEIIKCDIIDINIVMICIILFWIFYNLIYITLFTEVVKWSVFELVYRGNP